MKKWDHDELANDLADFLRQSSELMIWTDMQMGPAGSRRPDVYTINKSYSRFVPITYEIKVSKSDFNSDVKSGKWQEYLQFSAGVYFAVPAGMVSKADIPAHAGLIVRNEEGWRRLRTPTLSKVATLPHEAWMKLLIDGIPREAERQKYQLQCARPEANIWMMRSELNKRFGEQLGDLIARGMRNADDLETIVQEQEKKLNAERLKFNATIQEERDKCNAERVVLMESLNQIREQVGLKKYHSPAMMMHYGDLTVPEVMRQIQSKISEEHQISELRNELSQLQSRITDTLSRLP